MNGIANEEEEEEVEQQQQAAQERADIIGEDVVPAQNDIDSAVTHLPDDGKTRQEEKNEEGKEEKQSILKEISPDAGEEKERPVSIEVDETDVSTLKRQSSADHVTFQKTQNIELYEIGEEKANEEEEEVGENEDEIIAELTEEEKEAERYRVWLEELAEEEEEEEEENRRLELLEIEKAESAMRRRAITAQYNAAQNQNRKYQLVNDKLQHQLQLYFNRTFIYNDPKVNDPDSADKKQTYHSLLDQLIQKQNNEIEYKWTHEQSAEHLENQWKKVNDLAEKQYNKQTNEKKKAIMVRTGNMELAEQREMCANLFVETNKNFTMATSEENFQFLKTTKDIQRLQKTLKEREKIGDQGHDRSEFEQMKMISTIFNEKSEDIKESISILRRKLSFNIHLITHMKEKAAQISAKNNVQQKKLDALGALVDEQRLILIVAKRVREDERRKIIDLKEHCALLAHPQLLLDMENKIDSVASTQSKFAQLERTCAKHKAKFTVIRKKMDTFRTPNYLKKI